MKTVSANLKAHLQGETLTICTLCKITRTDSQVFGFTDNTRDVVYGGVTYYSSTGYSASNIKSTATLGVDNLDISALFTDTTITEADVLARVWDFAQVEILLINYLSLGDGDMILRKGWLGDVRIGKGTFVAEFRGMTQPLQQTIGRIYTPGCDAKLGDARCGVTLASYTVTGSVTAATSAQIFTDTTRLEADGYFDGGLITWTSGNNNTYRMEIKTSTSAGVITLQEAMPFATVIGNTYSMSSGCNKLLSTCKTKFNNVVNFRGFPHIPGMDRMVSGL